MIDRAYADAKENRLLYQDGKAGCETISAPFYALMTTFRWRNLALHLAKRVGATLRVEEVDGTSFVRFTDQAVVGALFVRRLRTRFRSRCCLGPKGVGQADDTRLRDALSLRAQTLRQKVSQ